MNFIWGLNAVGMLMALLGIYTGNWWFTVASFTIMATSYMFFNWLHNILLRMEKGRHALFWEATVMGHAQDHIEYHVMLETRWLRIFRVEFIDEGNPTVLLNIKLERPLRTSVVFHLTRT